MCNPAIYQMMAGQGQVPQAGPSGAQALQMAQQAPVPGPMQAPAPAAPMRDANASNMSIQPAKAGPY